ncbi:MAG: HEAT repeat domain-containing protein [Anaerolineae bacterium]|nr:HEAT repeat domain-containing protein [Gemmatimonadaceae bacterium]
MRNMITVAVVAASLVLGHTPIDAQRAVPANRTAGFANRAPGTELRAPRSFRTNAEATYPGDPADSLYRAARSAMNRSEYGRAAELFRQVTDRFPKSAYAGDALYWQGFALYRRGSNNGDLENAVKALELQGERYPKASTRSDAQALLVRIRGELARRGDEGSGRRIAQDAGRATARCPADDDDDDMRIAALNALQQMDSDQALPILREVLDRRDACSVALRRKAVFLVAQTNTEAGGELLVKVIGSDPDAEVRRQAVFWLSEVPGERAVTVLDSILRNTRDTDIQEKAVFALSQHESSRARVLLRGIAESGNITEELRSRAIFAIGHHSGTREDGVFLRSLYPRLTSERLRETLIQSVAQIESADVRAWLLSLVSNDEQPLEVRKKALFWAGQNVTAVSDLINLYEELSDQEMREQLIWVLSDRKETKATDKLIDIARNDKNRESRKKAIFWLGQQNDPRVKKLLLEIINQ